MAKSTKDTTSDRMAKFLAQMDFKLLKEQKTALFNIQAKMDKPKAKFTQKDVDVLEGLLCLIDALQDEAVDNYGYNEKRVFRISRKDK